MFDSAPHHDLAPNQRSDSAPDHDLARNRGGAIIALFVAEGWPSPVDGDGLENR
jgi:hypothetical protein